VFKRPGFGPAQLAKSAKPRKSGEQSTTDTAANMQWQRVIVLAAIVRWYTVTGSIETESVDTLQFRRVGFLSGTTAMTHIVLRVNLSQHYEQIKRLCHKPFLLYNSTRVLNPDYKEVSSVQLINSLTERCLVLEAGFLERKHIWYNPLNRGFEERADAAAKHIHQQQQEAKGQAKGNSIEGRNGRDYHLPNVDGEEDVEWVEYEDYADYLAPVLLAGRRFRRQIWVASVIVVAAVIAVSSAIYSVYELNAIASASEADQQMNVQVLQEHETRLQIDNRSLEILNKTLAHLDVELAGFGVRLSRDEVFMHLALSLDTMFDEYHRIERGLNALSQNRITPDLLMTKATTKAIKHLSRRMRSLGYTLALDSYQDLFQCQTSHLMYKNNSLVIMIHIPAVKDASKLQLLQYSSLPMTIEDKHGETVSVLPEPEGEFLAVTEGEGWFKVMSAETLRQCEKIAGVYYCEQANVYDRRVKANCLLSLFKRDTESVAKLCQFKSNPATDYALQVGKVKFLVYQHEERSVKLVCEGITEGEMSFQGALEIKVPAGCRLFTESFVLDGQVDYSVAVDMFYAKELNFSEVLDVHGFDTSGFVTALKALQLVGSPVGLKIADVKMRYHSHLLQKGFTVSFTVAIGIILIVVGVIGWRRRGRREEGGPRINNNLFAFSERFRRTRRARGQEDPEVAEPPSPSPPPSRAPLAIDEVREDGSVEGVPTLTTGQLARLTLEADRRSKRSSQVLVTGETALVHEQHL